MKLLSSASATKPNVSLRSPDQAMEETIARLQRVKPIRVRFPRLERLCRPQSESFWVLGGRPGSFKTGLAWNLALNAAESGHRVLFVSLEQTPAEIALLALCRFSGLDRRRIEAHFLPGEQRVMFGGDQQSAWDRSVLRLQALEMNLRVHGAEEHGRAIDDVLRSASRAKFDAVFVDHAGMIGRDHGHELDVLAHAVDRLRGLSRGEVVKDYRPWVCVTTQLSRGKDKEERIPLLSDFRGSARFEHDADVAIGLEVRKRPADSESPESMLDGFVLKNRFGPPAAVLLFEANGATGFISERTATPTPEPEAE